MNGYEDDEGWPVAVIAPYSPQDSTLYTLTILPEDHDDIMPSSGDPLTNEETEIIRKWIQGGADFGVFNSPKYVNPKSKEAAEAAAKASE